MSVPDTECVIFKDRFKKLFSIITPEQIKTFSDFKTNGERIKFLFEFDEVRNHPIKLYVANKSVSVVKKLKEFGNLEFKKENYKCALTLYSQCLIKYPETVDTSDIAILYANRSACLYYLNEYNYSLNDIQQAFDLNYPEELSYKLYERRVKCFLALKNYKNAKNAFRDGVLCLDKCKLPLNKRQKWQKDIQILIERMSKQNNIANGKEVLKNDSDKIYKNRNKVYVSASSAIRIKYSEKMGRYAEAICDIPAGEIVLMEESHCAVLLQEFQYTHCFQCLKRVIALHPCPWCDLVVFCSTDCRTSALISHHRIECKILTSLWSSEVSIICHMALRIISQQTIQNLFKIKKDLSAQSTLENRKYIGSDYRQVYKLVTHEDKRKIEDLLQRVHMSIYLTKCLKISECFFNTKEEDCTTHLSDDEVYVAELILHNLQLLQFNAHEISELQIANKNIQERNSVFIGGALYPTLALFNHSCNPSIVRYFDGSKVISRVIRNIKAGQMVEENYGPMFTETCFEERQKTLKEQYWFECKCEACTEQWPLINMIQKNKVMRFRCTNDKCQSVIPVPCDTMEFVLKCIKCGTSLNILRGLKTLQDMDSKFMAAKQLLKNQEIDRSLNKFLEILQTFDSILVPPFWDYHMCQQALRTCFLKFGNAHNIS